MWNCHFRRVSLGCFLCLAMFLAGCTINLGGWAMRAKYERTVRLSAPLSPGSTFAAETHNGSITTNGADVADCDLTATIVARAATEEEARELAEKVEVSLEPSGNRLTVKIKKPTHLVNKSVSVSLDATVPDRTDLELRTHNGAVRVADITGHVNATTHNGKVATERVSGAVVLETHNGAVTCTELSGDAKLKTHNGSVEAYYSETASSANDISIATYNGGIAFTAPPGLSARVDASTHNGSINTDLPITVSGKVSKRRLTGIIGSGQGRLHLETYNGSIRIQ